MKLQAYYLNKYVDEETITLSTNNRSFLYGDGIFETIIIKNGLVCFLDYHIDRLTNGLMVIGIETSFLPNFKKVIAELLSINELDNSRVKIHVWRASGGLYEPLFNEPQVLVTMHPWKDNPHSLIKTIGFSKKVFLSQSITSRFKTNNSMPYVIAADERKARKLDEIILLDNHGHIAECTSSNIFWTDGTTYFTPSLSTGCIEGIMRRHVLTTAKANDVVIIEGEFKKEVLSNATSIFCCNVAGVVPILQIEDKTLSPQCGLIPLLGL